MADGTKVLETPEVLHAVLLDAATAATNGTWFDLGAHRKDVALHVDGINGDTISITGSSTTTIPANATHADLIGSTITADGHLALTAPPRFIKARISTYSAGTVSVYVVASR
jgi:hypothetical protein